MSETILQHLIVKRERYTYGIRTGVAETVSEQGSDKTTEQLVCGGEASGLETVNISTGCWTRFDFPATLASISTLSNRTMVANVRGSGIQLLWLDQEHASPQQPTSPLLTTYLLDEGRIVTIVPATNDRVILLETATMSQVFSNPAHGSLSVVTDHTIILCASLKNKIATRCFQESVGNYLEMWEFSRQHPRWTIPTTKHPSVGSISLAGTRLVTFHNRHSQSFIRIWDAFSGRLLAQTLIDDPHVTPPLGITFYWEDRFYFYHNTHRVPHVINTASRTDSPYTHSITRLEKQQLDGQVQEKRYRLDDGREWVFCGSERICWIPPGYIGSAPGSHLWIRLLEYVVYRSHLWLCLYLFISPPITCLK